MAINIIYTNPLIYIYFKFIQNFLCDISKLFFLRKKFHLVLGPILIIIEVIQFPLIENKLI